MVEDINGIKICLNTLMENINQKSLNNIQQFFRQNNNGKLNKNQLKTILESYNVILSDEDFKPLFAKIDVKKEGTVDYLQLISYLETEFEIKRTQNELNDGKNSRLMPILVSNKFIEDGNKNQYQIVGIITSKSMMNNDSQPTFDEEDKTDEKEYLTATATGEVLFWSTDMKWKKTQSLSSKKVP